MTNKTFDYNALQKEVQKQRGKTQIRSLQAHARKEKTGNEEKNMNLFKRKPIDPEVDEAYKKAYREERLVQAKVKGKADAVRKAAQKPFYQKLVGGMEGLAKNVSVAIPESDGFGMFSEPKKKRKTKRKRKR